MCCKKAQFLVFGMGILSLVSAVLIIVAYALHDMRYLVGPIALFACVYCAYIRTNTPITYTPSTCAVID